MNVTSGANDKYLREGFLCFHHQQNTTELNSGPLIFIPAWLDKMEKHV